MKQTPPGPQLLPVGGVLRFALGQASGPRSNTWSVVGGKNTDEVYLAARETMASAKVSMHSSGRWRWAMTEQEAVRRQLGLDEDRVMWRWVPPAPIGPGWMHAARIVIPSSSIQRLGPEEARRGRIVSYWQVDPGLREVWFDIFICKPGAPQLTMHNITEPVGRIELPSGGAVWVVGTEWAVSDEREAIFRELRKRSRDFYIEREGLDAFNQYQQPTAANWATDNDDGKPVGIDLGDLRDAEDSDATELQGPEIGPPEPPEQDTKSPESAPQKPESPKPEILEFMCPDSSAQVSPPPPQTGSKRPQWKKYRPSLILGLLGLAMLPAGFFLYPSVAELPTPGYSQLVIKSNTPIGAIQYGVAQISEVAAEITVRVSLAPGAADGTATLTLLLPFGNTFINCRLPNCHAATPAGSYWSKQLTLRSNGGSFLAIPHIFVRANHFGAISNGVTASAVIPEVVYYGPSAPAATLLAGYKISSGDSYDWSSFQPQSFTKGFVVWAENFTVGDTQSRVAVGINHDAQTNDDFIIFLAGAVVALAGAAILAAIQEALHARDKDS